MPTSTSSPWRALRQQVRLRTRLRDMARPIARQIALRRNPLPEDVASLYERYSHDKDAVIPGYASCIGSRVDAGVVFNLVRRHRPRHVLEFGCGLGTLTSVVAMALEANGEGRVTSLEHLGWMVDKAKQLMPERCRDRVEIRLCDTEVRKYFGEEWTCYRFRPSEADLDMLIVDGPPTEVEDERGLRYVPNGDLLECLPFLRPGCIVFVDERLSSVAAYQRHLAAHFRFESSILNYTLMTLVKPVEGPVG